MKVRVSIVYEFDSAEFPQGKSVFISEAITQLYKMPLRKLEDICRVQVAKETWLDVEE